MSKHSKLKEAFKGLLPNKDSSTPFFATIVSIQVDTCTIKFDGIELDEVRLKASIGEGDGLLLTPKVGSKVLLMSLTGSLDDLIVLRADSYESIVFKENGLEFELDTSTKKVSIKNSQVSLLDIFNELKTVLTNLKVNTPAGPSVGLLPDTMTALAQFETHFKQLLK